MRFQQRRADVPRTHARTSAHAHKRASIGYTCSSCCADRSGQSGAVAPAAAAAPIEGVCAAAAGPDRRAGLAGGVRPSANSVFATSGERARALVAEGARAAGFCAGLVFCLAASWP